MNNLLTNQNGGFPFNLDDLRWTLGKGILTGDGTSDAGIYQVLETLIKNWNTINYNSVTYGNFIIDGMYSNNYPLTTGAISEGWIYNTTYGILRYDFDNTKTYNINYQLYYTESYEPGTTKIFKDGSPNKETHLKKRLVLSNGVPSGYVVATPIIYSGVYITWNLLNIHRLENVIAAKMRASSSQVQTGSDDIKFLTSASLKNAAAVGLNYNFYIGTNPTNTDASTLVNVYNGTYGNPTILNITSYRNGTNYNSGYLKFTGNDSNTNNFKITHNPYTPTLSIGPQNKEYAITINNTGNINIGDGISFAQLLRVEDTKSSEFLTAIRNKANVGNGLYVQAGKIATDIIFQLNDYSSSTGVERFKVTADGGIYLNKNKINTIISGNLLFDKLFNTVTIAKGIGFTITSYNVITNGLECVVSFSTTLVGTNTMVIASIDSSSNTHNSYVVVAYNTTNISFKLALTKASWTSGSVNASFIAINI